MHRRLIMLSAVILFVIACAVIAGFAAPLDAAPPAALAYQGSIGPDAARANACYPVEWNADHAVGVNFGSGVITKTGTEGWTAGAISRQALAARTKPGVPGGVQAQVASVDDYFSFGLSFAGDSNYGDADQSFEDIDYGVYAYPPTGLIQARQRGAVLKNLGTYSQGDVLRVEYDGAQVKFYQNDTTVYTATGVLSDADFPAAIDTSFYNPGASLRKVQICGSNVIDLTSAPETLTPVDELPTQTATPTVPAPGFSDVHGDDYFYRGAALLRSRGVVSGYADGTFRPYAPITRGQLTKLVVRAYGMLLVRPASPTFSDVPPDDPFYAYIETAATLRMVTGYGDGTFRPYADLTRGQLAKLVVLGLTIPLADGGQARFRDVPVDSPFYRYIETAYRAGLISGYADGTFRPDIGSIRGQIVKIVYQAILRRGAAPGQQSDASQPGNR